MIEELLFRWRLVGVVACAAFGVFLLCRALHWHGVFRGTLRDPFRANALARSIRLAIAGSCALAVGWGIHADITLLIVVAGVILGEELLETTVIVTALEDDPEARRAATAASHAEAGEPARTNLSATSAADTCALTMTAIPSATGRAGIHD